MTTSKRRTAIWLERIDALPVAHTMLIAAALGVLVVDADLITGSQISFSVFYIAPISLVAWRLGRKPAVVSAVVAAGAWYCVELIGGREYSQALIPAWNGLVRLAFFAIIASLLVTLRDSLREQSADARVDTLTGVLNRRGFNERANIELVRAERSLRPLTVASFDIDHFKRLNDTAGHAAGDEVLRQVGETMRAALRDVDVLGRLGGDEFAVLLPETDEVSAHLVLDRLNRALCRATAETGIGFSFGAVTFLHPPASIDAALGRADVLMYAAKAHPQLGIRLTVERAATREPAPPRAPAPS